MDRQVRPDALAAPPEAEAAVVVLQRPQPLDVALHGLLELLGLRQALGLEGAEHVAQRRDREHARGELLGALERIGDEVEDRVGQRLEGRRRRRDLEAAELGTTLLRAPAPAARSRPSSITPYVAKASVVAGVHTGSSTSAASAHGPDAAPTWNRAVPARSAAIGKRTSTRSFAATTSRRPGAVGERGVPGAHGHVHAHRAVGLVLHDDRQLEAVAEVQEARRGRPHHQRQPRGERRLGRSRSVARPETATAMTR